MQLSNSESEKITFSPPAESKLWKTGYCYQLILYLIFFNFLLIFFYFCLMFLLFLSITSPLVSFFCDLTILSSSILFKLFCKIQFKKMLIFYFLSCCTSKSFLSFFFLCLRSAASQGFSIRPVERGWKCDCGCPDWLSLTFWRNPLSCPHSLLLHLLPSFRFRLFFTSSFPGFIVPAPLSCSPPLFSAALCRDYFTSSSQMRICFLFFSPQKFLFTLI